MIYILHKNKIISYTVASFIVLALFAFSTSFIPQSDVEVIKVSSNFAEQNTAYNNESNLVDYNQLNNINLRK